MVLAPTVRAGDATRLAAQGVAQGHDVIVAAGGDGTVNEVVNGIGASGALLGVLPLGTVNVFARELRIPLRLAAAWQVIEQGTTRSLDLAQAEFGGQRRWFVQLAGIGLDAHAVRSVSWELKKRIGPLSYVWAALKIMRRDHVELAVVADGGAVVQHGAAVFVGNGRFYGGPFRLFPSAQLDDGKLDVCIFESTHLLSVLRYSLGLLRGAHPELRGVIYFQAAEVTCRAASAVPFQLDGEDAGDTPVRFTVKPRALRVLAPNIKQADG